VPELDSLLAALDAIEACCRDEDWDAATRQFADYDSRLRGLPPGALDERALRQLLDRQQQLAERMREGHEAASAALQQMAAQKRSTTAYRG